MDSPKSAVITKVMMFFQGAVCEQGVVAVLSVLVYYKDIEPIVLFQHFPKPFIDDLYVWLSSGCNRNDFRASIYLLKRIRLCLCFCCEVSQVI